MNIERKHQHKIALDTLRMPDAMVGVMGGMTKAEAARFLAASAQVVANRPGLPSGVYVINVKGLGHEVLFMRPIGLGFIPPTVDEVAQAIADAT